jgi:shikimate dehydrogenase
VAPETTGRRKVVLIGHGISYSRSPAMQNAAFRAAGIDWTYELLDVPPDQLAAAVDGLRAHDVGGANVTIPHKLAVMKHLDRLDADALRAHAVNTISRDHEHLVGSNTDVAGIQAAVDDVGVEPRGANVVVLGVGGSARAAAVVLDGAHITFVARHPENAGELPGRVIAWSDPAWAPLVRSADLLLNATPLGRRDEMPIRPNALPQKGSVIDLVYVPGGTPLVRKARSLGLPAADGWGVLLAQGARSFEIWTGRPAPLAAMREALEA